MIYFDNAATTFPKPECVYLELDRANRSLAFNAGRGESKESEMAASAIRSARLSISSLLPQATPNHVVFECSATEALNMIIFGLGLSGQETVYLSPFEHNSIIRPLHILAEKGNIRVLQLPFDKTTWEIDEKKMADMFAAHHPSAVFLSQISNVTGYDLPYETVFSAARRFGAVTILDAAQGFGVFPIRKPELCSYIVFAGHKSLYGSFGVAGFVKNGSDALGIVKAGGTGSDSLSPDMPSELPSRFEAGSMNVVAIDSLNASIKWLKEHDVASHETDLARYFRNEIKNIDKIIDFQPEGISCKGIVSFDVEGLTAEQTGAFLSEECGISVRTGFHCAPYVHEFIGSERFLGTVRCSFGFFNTKEQIDVMIDALRRLIRG